MNTEPQTTHTLATRFREDGFVIAHGLLDPREVDRVEAELRRYIDQLAPTAAPGNVFYESGTSGPIKHLSMLDRHDGFFKALLERPATMDLIAALIGAPVESVASEVFYKPANVGSAAPYHQDNAYLHLDPPDAAVVWLALDDTTLENGAVHFARGSHKLGDRRHDQTGVQLFSKGLAEDPDISRLPEVPAILKRGDASIHHVLCAHRSGPNRTNHHRRGVVLNYKAVHAKVDQARAAAHREYVERLNQS